MNQILLIIAITIGCSIVNIKASGQNGNGYKMIDSTIYSYKKKDFMTKKIKQKDSNTMYVYNKKTESVYAVQLIRFSKDSLNMYTYFYLKDEVSKITVNIHRVSHSKPPKSLGEYYFNSGRLIGQKEKNIHLQNFDSLLNEGKEYLLTAKQLDFKRVAPIH